MLLEKAIAKEYGSYENLHGGAIDYACMLMTGKPAFRYILSNDDIKMRIADNSLWMKLLDFAQKDFLLGAGTKDSKDIPAKYSSISGNHAYAILDACVFDGNRLIQLRDPRGSSCWKGDWSANSPKWTSRIKGMLQERQRKRRRKINNIGDSNTPPLVIMGGPLYSPVPHNQQTFFVSWEEFIQCFEVIFVTIFFDREWNSEKINDEWIRSRDHNSCLDSVRNSHQYLLNVEDNTEVFCLLEHLIPASERNLPQIGFEIYKFNGKLIGENGNIPELVAIGRYSTERAISLNCKLEKGKYIVLLSISDPDQYGKFTFTMWYPEGNERRDNKKITLKKIEQPL